jgi:DNA gyrase/topoisomerase IV subunit B
MAKKSTSSKSKVKVKKTGVSLKTLKSKANPVKSEKARNPLDDKMIYIESDIKKIQTKPNMYIHEFGTAGAFHLGREVIQNNIDECNNTKSNGNLVEIEYDTVTDILSCKDNGRGFSEADYPLDIYCTTLQSGSKFYRTDGGASSGEFGVKNPAPVKLP